MCYGCREPIENLLARLRGEKCLGCPPDVAEQLDELADKAKAVAGTRNEPFFHQYPQIDRARRQRGKPHEASTAARTFVRQGR